MLYQAFRIPLVIVVVAVSAGVIAYRLERGGGQASQPSDHDRVEAGAVAHIDKRPRSTFQEDILADGQLTEAEYDLAYAKFTECVVAAGGEILGPGTKTRWGEYDFDLGIPPLTPGSPNTEALSKVGDCDREYFNVVGPRWSASHMVPREVIDAELAKVPACMRASGVEPPKDLFAGWGNRFLTSASREASSVLNECLKAASAAAGLPSSTYATP